MVDLVKNHTEEAGNVIDSDAAPSKYASFGVLASAATVSFGAGHIILGATYYGFGHPCEPLMLHGSFWAVAGLCISTANSFTFGYKYTGAVELVYSAAAVSSAAAIITVSGDYYPSSLIVAAGALTAVGVATYHIYDTYFLTHKNDEADIFNDASSLCASDLSQVACGGIDNTY